MGERGRDPVIGRLVFVKSGVAFCFFQEGDPAVTKYRD